MNLPDTLGPVPIAGAPAATPPQGGAWRGGWLQGLRYGALGLPLAFVALPLYVVLPNHYASEFGIPLATLGALLLGARLLDAGVDPFIGGWADSWFRRGTGRAMAAAVLAAGLLALGFRGLFFPPSALRADPTGLLLWCGVLLALTYLSYSVLSVLHQAWGARLGGDQAQRARIVSWREGLALVGVLVASVLPSVAGLGWTGVVFTLALVLGLWALSQAPRPVSAPHPDVQPGQALPASGPTAAASIWAPLATRGFRRLLAVYLVNGVASAVPATLVLFFIRDRLQADSFEPLFLASYFAAGALSMPLWLRCVSRFGLPRAWLLGMALAVLTFAWAATLGAGDVMPFVVVCLASGVALGADLAIPPALLAGTIQRAGHGQRLEGAYFGWWNFATKLNLALAAGIALPLLAQFGYTPGVRDGQALQALTVAYCLLPCLLKTGAAVLLWQSGLLKENNT